MNTFDWLAQLDIQDAPSDFDLVEVSFKHGSRKDFFHNPSYSNAGTGDMVLVEIPGGGGFDVGEVSLMGDMVRLQMKKKMVKSSALFLNVIRRANPRDVEKLEEVRTYERDMMIRGRAIARTLDLDMKIGDVEFQGDGRKVTFLYTADGRVDFRELIRHFAKEFKVKIEMRQIGFRDNAKLGAKIGQGPELTDVNRFRKIATYKKRKRFQESQHGRSLNIATRSVPLHHVDCGFQSRDVGGERGAFGLHIRERSSARKNKIGGEGGIHIRPMRDELVGSRKVTAWSAKRHVCGLLARANRGKSDGGRLDAIACLRCGLSFFSFGFRYRDYSPGARMIASLCRAP